MKPCHVSTSNGRIFYTSISLNDRIKQYNVFRPIDYTDYTDYQVFSPIGYRPDYLSYFMNRVPKRPRNEIYQSLNRFEKAPVIWDSNFYEHSSIWTFFRESPWNSFDPQEPEIYKPVAKTKRKRKKRKKAVKKTITKQQLDDELDQYMINVE